MIYYFSNAFNPLTLEHQKIIKNIMNETLNIDDKIIFGVLTYNYEDFELESRIRYEMLFNFMIQNFVKKFNWKVYYQFKNYWEYLHEIFKDDEQQNICLILTQDEYDNLKSGKTENSEELLNTYKIKIIPEINDVSEKIFEIFKSDEKINFETVKAFISKEIYEFFCDFYMK